MDDLFSSLMVILVTGALVAGIFWFSHKSKKQNEDALRRLAGKHGWNFEPISENLAWGFHLTSSDWKLTAESRSIGQASDSGSSNIRQNTQWQTVLKTPALFPLQIGPRLSDFPAFSSSIDNPLAGVFGGLSDSVSGLQEIDLGITELTKKYIILGELKMDYSLLRMSPIPHILLDWPDKILPLVVVSLQKIEIKINGHRMEKPEEIERLVNLGEALIKASKY